MYPNIVVREITAAASDLGHLSNAGGFQRHSRADSVAIAGRAFEPNRKPIAAGRVFAQQGWSIVHIHNQDVDIAVVVVVAERRSPAGLHFQQRASDFAGDFTEPSAS